jgi:hypothetical protein
MRNEPKCHKLWSRLAGFYADDEARRGGVRNEEELTNHRETLMTSQRLERSGEKSNQIMQLVTL